MRSAVVRSILAAALVAFLPIGAEAAWDMSGKWLLVPPGGDCDGEPCWQPRADAYKYTDRTGAKDGILSMNVERYRGFQLKGRGVNLPLPAGLSTSSTLIPLLATREGHDIYSTSCWSHPVTSERRTATLFRGGYRPGP